jgi:hypothetical protein
MQQFFFRIIKISLKPDEQQKKLLHIFEVIEPKSFLQNFISSQNKKEDFPTNVVLRLPGLGSEPGIF